MKGKNTSKELAAGGFTVLLTVLFLYFSYILPTGRLFFFSLSTVFISVMVIEYGKKAAFMTYIASSLLGFIIIPDKIILLPYLIFFGYYGIIKSLLENRDSLIFEWLMKILSYNTGLLIFYLLYTSLFNLPLTDRLPLAFLILILELFFVIYDYSYTLAVSYYMSILRDMIKK